MSGAWAIRLALADARALASLRLVPGVEISVSDSEVWARCQHLDESLEITIRGLPAIARYAWLEEDELLEAGRRIPSLSLPSTAWIPISEWILPTLPAAAQSGELPEPQPLKLVRSPEEQPGHLLLTDLREWVQYVSTAGEIRLAHLSFATNSAGQALIRGNPLPPLPGQRWREVEGVAIPLGYRWDPEISPATLARVWGVGNQRLALWHPQGQAEWVQLEQFIPASRANIRATCTPELFSP